MATDISENILKKAQDSIYSEFELTRGIDMIYKDYFSLYKEGYYKVKDFLLEKVEFKQLNLKDDLDHLDSFDFVLCRNVSYLSK